MTAQKQLLDLYGLPDAAYQSKYCVIWKVKNIFQWFPAAEFFVNKAFQRKLLSAFAYIEYRGIQSEIKSFNGCFQQRQVRGEPDLISLHSWACAIDMNASIEKLGQTTTHWSPEFIQCMIDAGIFWGGNFHNRKDPMHFAMLDG